MKQTLTIIKRKTTIHNQRPAANTRLCAVGGWSAFSRFLLPHSLCRSATVNAPANRQMPIASVVSSKFGKRKETKIAYNFNEEIWLQIVEKDKRITAVRVEITWKVLSEKTIVKNSLIMIVCVVKNSYFYAWVNKLRVKRLKEQTGSFKEHKSIVKE